MKVHEFETHMSPDGVLQVPAEIVSQIPGDNALRVVLVVGDSAEGDDWSRLTAERFFAGYAESDEIYDAL